MGGLAAVIGSVLSWLHQYPINVCPGGWPWTVSLAGALVALSPVLGAMLVALVRKGTGNNYGAPVLIVFGLFGGVFGFLLPWLGASFTSNVVHQAVTTGYAAGLTTQDVVDLRQNTCLLSRFGTQGQYLGLGHTVYEALMPSSVGTFAFVVYLLMLVGVPVLCLFTVLFQQRIALRRGPGWPGRLMWLPFLAFGVATIPFEANLMAQFWLGFLVAGVAGLLLVALLGTPGAVRAQPAATATEVAARGTALSPG